MPPSPTASRSPIDLVGVLDLRGGLAVHAAGGDRRHYQPITAVRGQTIAAGDALAVADFYRTVCGLDAMYVADLDAIAGQPWQHRLITQLAARCRTLWLDAGVTTVHDAERAIGAGAGQVIVGLETLRSFDALSEICARLPRGTVAFSLDLRHGSPVHREGTIAPGITPAEIAARAAGEGAGTIIVLDVGRVGSGSGADLPAMSAVRRAAPDVTLLAGGGIRNDRDLAALADAGCDAALVATALLNGTLVP